VGHSVVGVARSELDHLELGEVEQHDPNLSSSTIA
jgi:hypothetical protein